VLIKHPMETGQRKDPKTGALIPAHYIQEVNAEHSGNNVLKALWGIGISANPYLSFKFTGANKGDKVTVSWLDNKGETSSIQGAVA
jgi:sulfur-oxidizing protein SoxZ